jgi:hypothetical protein
MKQTHVRRRAEQASSSAPEQDRLGDRGSRGAPALRARSSDRSMHENVMALQRSIGNAATSQLLQRQSDEEREDPNSRTKEALEAGPRMAHEALAAKELFEKGKMTTTKFIEEAAEEADKLGGLSDARLLAKGTEVGILGPLNIAFGGINLFEGIKHGDPSQAVSGGVDVLGGAAMMGAAAAPALAPVAPAAAAFGLAKEVTEMGMEDSPWDFVGTASGWGEAVNEKLDSRAAGGVVTVAASLPLGLIAFGYGVKHVAMRYMTMQLQLDDLLARAHPEVAEIDLGPTEERVGPATEVAHETLPPGPDPWAVSPRGGRLTKARLRRAKRVLHRFLARLASAPAPGR